MTRYLILLFWLLTGCSNCGGSAPPGDVGVSDTATDLGIDIDARDVDEADAGSDADAGDGGPNGAYDPSLRDLGAPPETCNLSIGAQTDTADARFFLASYRIDLEALATLETFRESIHQQVFDEVLGCRHATAPNVVVFPESMSLPMLAIGPTAERARDAATAEGALTQLALAASDAFRFYGVEYPETDIGARLLLARTDTVVRAFEETFVAIARKYGVWVSVTVDLPDYERTTEPDVVATLADPDIGPIDHAYRASTAEVTNRQILIAPDGTIAGTTHKVYVTQLELDQLALTPGQFSNIAPMQTPWGRTGVVISKPAWMVDVQDRLDDLGTTIYLQPEAFAGGWTLQTKPQAPDRWEPDVFVQGGWNLIQRSARGVVDLVPQLTGNFFDIVFDAQLQIVEHSSRTLTTGSFVGQQSLPGQVSIGPWAVPDPVEDNPALSLAERRALLRSVGEELAAGTADAGVDYVAGWAAYDVETYIEDTVVATVQTHPSAVVVDGDLWLAFSSGEIGMRGLTMQRFTDPGQGPTETFEVTVPGGDVIRPHVGVFGGAPRVLFEAISANENTAFVTDGTASPAEVIDASPVYRPRSTGSSTGEYRVVVREIDGANRVFVKAPAVDWTAVEPRPAERTVLRANQWDPDVAALGDEALVVWSDFKNWRWEIWGSSSTDAGATWSEPFGIALGDQVVETFHSTPRVLAIDPGTFVVSWTDLRTDRLQSAAYAATVELGASPPAVGSSIALSQPEDWAWRPSGVVDAGSVRFVWEAMNPDASRSVKSTVVDPATGIAAPAVEVARRQSARISFPFVVVQGGSTWIGFEVTPARSSASAIEIVELP